MAFSLDPNKFLLEANEFSVPTRGNNLRRGQAYYSSTQAPGSMVTPMAPMIDQGGTNTLGTAADKENALGMRFAGEALSAFANKEAAEKLAEAERAAARAKSRGSMFGGLLSAAGSIGGGNLWLVMSASRKTWRHLQVSEVNDDLAAMAFAVQEIRGHS